MKEFNTTGVCIPSKHYMVDLAGTVNEIRKYVDGGKYFTINRARQYGKTTTIHALEKNLAGDYTVLSLDFQGISSAGFKTEEAFVRSFSRMLVRKKTQAHMPDHIAKELQGFIGRQENPALLDELFDLLTDWCITAEKPIVMIVDEVDSAANNQVFLDFLAQLRLLYLEKEKSSSFQTFQSVILAGVTDVKHLKSRIREEEDAKENSPWNIAADFTVDMSLSEDGIKEMLDEYEADHTSGMDSAFIARQIRDYTNGYPYLVSRICQLIDERVVKSLGYEEAWTGRGINEALKMILSETNTLFQSLTKNLNNYPKLKASIRGLLMEGDKTAYNPQQDEILQLQMYGLVRNDHGNLQVANRIFEMMLYNLFLSEEEMKQNAFSRAGDLAGSRFVEDNNLNMLLIIKSFIETYVEIFGPLKDRFKEKDGRELFLLYLKPIINGTGNYYIEAQTRDQTRTDVIVDYLGKRYVIELKIWRGPRYNADGEKQISDYLDYFGLTTGYMLSFNFNKKKKTGVEKVQIGDKILYEGTV